ncbi:hypothetical protein AA313_de0209674 [Arthrobotrys entomopaga]|nr:hypothetical protein AA313_de0209674 [Arthrobotrys entomopaga]
MAKSKRKPAVKSTPSAASTFSATFDNTAMTSNPIKTEGASDPMVLDSDQNHSSSSTLPAEETKTESRTVSPSPTSLRSPNFHTRREPDGALIQEEPDFEEDFIPAEGEEIDLTSLAVPAPAAEGEATTTSMHKRSIDETDDAGLEETQPKRRRTDDGTGETIETPTPTNQTSITAPVSSSSSLIPSVDRLPVTIWTEIFTYVGLPAIGKLRSVCKRFDEILEREYLWRRCRKIHCPDMPKPAFGMKEWDMWGLVRGTGCMMCLDHEGKGRGEDGLKVYWQFKVRCCEKCFKKNVYKEADLLNLKEESISLEVMKELISALPYGLVDKNFTWVPTTATSPTDLDKIYWNEDVSDIKTRYDQALQMDAAEEWLKGLEGEGYGHKADADRMEKWEVRVMHGNSYNPTANTTQQQQQQQKKNGGGDKGNNQQSITVKNTSNGIPVLVSNDISTFQTQSIPTFYQRNRQYGDRTHQDIEEIKAKRKTEIEAKCLKLNPPIPPEVLAHCSAFQASLKIAQPLNEQSWNALLPKILEQRAGAEMHEAQRQVQRKHLEQQLEDRKLLESQERDQWVKKERQWEESQAPVREMIAKIADEEIKAWYGKVTFETAPAFAAFILTAVRTRYYERGGVEEASSASDHTTPSNKGQDARPKVRQLVLENMKYVFDNKVKPMTDPCRRELFFCRACKDIAANPAAAAASASNGQGAVPPPKLYGFEGVIQHFAAKHTTDLSLGTVVVHWRSIWPEDAPFVVDPNEIKRLMTRPVGGAHHHHAANGAAGGLPPAPVLIRTTGPPVPVAVNVPGGGYGYPPPPPHQQHSHQHQHAPGRHSHQLHHGQPGPGPQPVMATSYGRGVPSHRQNYPMETPHHAGYHHTQPPALHHAPHHHAPPPSQVHIPQAHPSHPHHSQPYTQGPLPLAVPERGQHYSPHPQQAYPPQPLYQPHPAHTHAPPVHQPQHVQPHQPYGSYQQPYAQAPQPPQPQPSYNPYGTAGPSSRSHAGTGYAGSHHSIPQVPQPDAYGEAAKKEAEAAAEAAAAAAAAEKDRKDKIHYIANYAEQTWKNLGSIKNLEPAIRAFLMIHETVAAFEEKYRQTELSIQLFHEAIRAEIDGTMKFLKPGNVKFECQSCPKTSTRTFTLPLLLQHFESVHVARPQLGPSAKEQGVQSKRFNWLVDMIRLPAEEELAKMAGRPGFDKRKLAAVEKVYPGVFDKKVEAPVVARTAPIDNEALVTKHASKASLSAAEDFLNNLLPAAPSEIQTPKAQDVKKELSATSDSLESRDHDRSEATSRTLQSQSRQRSRSRSPVSVDSRDSRSRPRRRDSYDEYYRRPVARDYYAEDEYRYYHENDNVGYHQTRPIRRASPYAYDRFPSPPPARRYRVSRPSYDEYDMPSRERGYPASPPPHPPVARPVRPLLEPSPPSASDVPPPAGGLDYDDPPPPVIPVSGHAREARYAEDMEYRRAYHSHADYYDRVIERERYAPPPPPPPPPHAGLRATTMTILSTNEADQHTLTMLLHLILPRTPLTLSDRNRSTETIMTDTTTEKEILDMRIMSEAGHEEGEVVVLVHENGAIEREEDIFLLLLLARIESGEMIRGVEDQCNHHHLLAYLLALQEQAEEPIDEIWITDFPLPPLPRQIFHEDRPRTPRPQHTNGIFPNYYEGAPSYFKFHGNPLRDEQDEEFARNTTTAHASRREEDRIRQVLGWYREFYSNKDAENREFHSNKDVENMILSEGRVQEVSSSSTNDGKTVIIEGGEGSQTLVESELEDYVDTDMEELEDEEEDHEDEDMDEQWEWLEKASGMSAQDLKWATGLADGKGLAQLWEEGRDGGKDEDGSGDYGYDVDGDTNMSEEDEEDEEEEEEDYEEDYEDYDDYEQYYE